MADPRILANLEKMIAAGAPDEHIHQYLQAEGLSPVGSAPAPGPPGGAAFAAQQQGLGSAVPSPLDAGNAEFPGAPGPTEGLGQAFRQYAAGNTFGLGARAEALGRVAGGSAPDYSTALADVTGGMDQFAKDHPVIAGGFRAAGGLTTAGGLAKAGLTVAPRIAAAISPGAAGAGSGLLGRTAGLAAEGGLYGAADAAGSTYTGNPADYATNAAIGAGVGAGVGGMLPVAGQALGAAYRGASPYVAGPVSDLSRSASRKLTADLGADADVPGRLGLLGPEAMLADAGPNLQGRAQGVATKDGAGRAALVNRIKARDEGGNQRIISELNDTLGPAPVPSQIDASLIAKQKALSPLYDQAFAGAPPVDTSEALAFIGQKLQTAKGPQATALQHARDLLMVDSPAGLTPEANAEAVHNAKVALGSLMSEGNPQLGISKGAVNQKDGALSQVVGKLTGALENQVPGYADANLGFKTAARGREALQEGATLLDSGRDTVVRPAELASRLRDAPIEQQALLQSGNRAEIDRIVGTTANDRVALKSALKGDGSWNREKLGQLYGQDAADKLVNLLDREATFADTNTKVVQGSQTAQRTAAAAVVDTPTFPKIPVTANWFGLLGRGAQEAAGLGLGRAAGMGADATRAQLGDVLSRQGPARDAVVEALIGAASRRGATAGLLSDAVSSPVGMSGLLAAADPPFAGRRANGVLGVR